VCEENTERKNVRERELELSREDFLLLLVLLFVLFLSLINTNQ
jgi:hypothetical protein